MLKQIVIIFALFSFFGGYALAQEKPETEKTEKGKSNTACIYYWYNVCRY